MCACCAYKDGLVVAKLALKCFKSIGKNVRISSDARIYGENNISIGNNVRIDSLLSQGAPPDGRPFKVGMPMGPHYHSTFPF